ncbi:TlpA family protein disulfide reductase [Ornithinimicrobium pratense]|uniref:TlpA family protein disulfide reductase n=1 Tax=Ornithinimicrobium pratense TaxID=2593973 RepID=A0A5J6V1X2_9MICO|nr:TlpA disulfide reductase family protein [Ornithinimicrobium pratense]QFG67655.1 TlpA family protein disulfide reductase [Ornithinimicrobium pratense]
MSARKTHGPARAKRALALAPAALLLLSACSDDGTSINDQMRQGDQKGYVAGDGRIERLAPEERSTVIELSGTTLEDEPWDSQEHRGEVVVINVWGSWCGPCDAEAPDLVAVSEAYDDAGEPVAFIGVNHRDSVQNAVAFERRHGVPYPSLLDDGGRTLSQLQGLATSRPTTMLLDGEGRVAARVNGQVDASTLRGLVEDVLADESAPEATG